DRRDHVPVCRGDGSGDRHGHGGGHGGGDVADRCLARRAGAIVVKAINLDDIYGTPLAEWQRVEERLQQGMSQAPDTGGPQRHTCWLATINDDGSPHVTGIGALWTDRSFWFET